MKNKSPIDKATKILLIFCVMGLTITSVTVMLSHKAKRDIETFEPFLLDKNNTNNIDTLKARVKTLEETIEIKSTLYDKNAETNERGLLIAFIIYVGLIVLIIKERNTIKSKIKGVAH